MENTVLERINTKDQHMRRNYDWWSYRFPWAIPSIGESGEIDTNNLAKTLYEYRVVCRYCCTRFQSDRNKQAAESFGMQATEDALTAHEDSKKHKKSVLWCRQNLGLGW